jgi:hypothetical protein
MFNLGINIIIHDQIFELDDSFSLRCFPVESKGDPHLSNLIITFTDYMSCRVDYSYRKLILSKAHLDHQPSDNAAWTQDLKMSSRTSAITSLYIFTRDPLVLVNECNRRNSV